MDIFFKISTLNCWTGAHTILPHGECLFKIMELNESKNVCTAVMYSWVVSKHCHGNMAFNCGNSQKSPSAKIWTVAGWGKTFAFFEFLELFKIFRMGRTNYFFFMLYRSQFLSDYARRTLSTANEPHYHPSVFTSR